MDCLLQLFELGRTLEAAFSFVNIFGDAKSTETKGLPTELLAGETLNFGCANYSCPSCCSIGLCEVPA